MRRSQQSPRSQSSSIGETVLFGDPVDKRPENMNCPRSIADTIDCNAIVPVITSITRAFDGVNVTSGRKERVRGEKRKESRKMEGESFSLSRPLRGSLILSDACFQHRVNDPLSSISLSFSLSRSFSSERRLEAHS